MRDSQMVKTVVRQLRAERQALETLRSSTGEHFAFQPADQQESDPGPDDPPSRK